MSKQKRILTWHANWRRPGGRWRKYVDGRALYFGHGKSPADTKSYRAAERRYFEFMQERERTTPVEVPLAEATLADICEKFLQQLLERHDRSEVCPSYFDKARCCLEDFVGCVGGSKKFATTSELDLADYRSPRSACRSPTIRASPSS